jgi:hypothetical protein
MFILNFNYVTIHVHVTVFHIGIIHYPRTFYGINILLIVFYRFNQSE